MSEFQPGEIVDITIRGARVVEVCRHGDGNGRDLRFTYETTDGGKQPGCVWADAPEVNVARVAPAEWPPQKGDLWRDQDGHLWVGIERFDESPFIELECVNHGRKNPAWDDAGNHLVNQQYGPMTLVRREEAS